MHLLFLISLLTVFISRNDRNTFQTTDTLQVKLPSSTIRGDTVQELGDDLMVVYQDRNNNYWFGSWTEGVYRYDGKTILHFTTGNGLPDNRVEEIKEDKSGNIYVNTSKGISKFDGQTFTTLSVTNLENQWKLEQNDLWFREGGVSGYVYRYDGITLYKLQMPKSPNPSTPYEVYVIYKDSQGNVWFGTNPMGVYRYNGNAFDWITENDVTELHGGPANGVRSIIEDKEGYFWFNAMYRYKVYNNNTYTQTFYRREKSIGSLDGRLEGDLKEYLSVAKDNNGELWFATYNDGIWRYNGNTIIHYPIKDGANDITVFSIYKDNAGDIFLGTHESGAYKFNGQAFEKFSP